MNTDRIPMTAEALLLRAAEKGTIRHTHTGQKSGLMTLEVTLNGYLTKVRAHQDRLHPAVKEAIR